MRSRIYPIVVSSALLIAVGAIGALPCGPWCDQARAGAEQEPQSKSQDARSEDRAAIVAALDSFVKAFESRDAKALAAHWTAGGEYHPLEGTTVRGRETLEKGFTVFFARTPEIKAAIRHEAVRFLSHDSAIEEGVATIRRGPLEPATSIRYHALVVREDGKWRVAQLTESAGEPESLEDLGWLVGKWKSKGRQGAEIETTYAWHSNKKFLQANFTIKEKAHTFSGTQVIGVDPATGSIHSWTFEADGGVGEADWHRDGDHWIAEASGTMSDGRTLNETNVLRRINDDTFTWQSTNRSLEDDDLADLPPVKITRVAPGG
jgi:uncharacterized protein (TIGR02246 family)